MQSEGRATGNTEHSTPECDVAFASVGLHFRTSTLFHTSKFTYKNYRYRYLENGNYVSLLNNVSEPQAAFDDTD